MARNTFAVGELHAAQPGLSRLAQSLVGGDQAYQQGFDGTVAAQTKIAQEIAAARASNAQAGYHDAQAANERQKTGIVAGRPGLFEEQAANAAGTDIPTIQNYRKQLSTGQAPLVPMGPPTEEGAMGTGSMVLPDATRSKIAGAIQQFLPLLSNSGDLKPDDLAQAAQIFRQSGLSDDIIAGRADRNAVGGAQAAAAGKPMFNQNADGAVLDEYGGGLNTANPMAKASIGLRGAQAGEASARGRLATAQAGEVGAPKFDSGSGTVVDARTATARTVIGQDGKPIAGKGGSLNQEQANALTFASRMQAANDILAGQSAQGVSQPGAIKRTAESLPGWLGGGDGGNMGSMTNWTQSGGQQEVEQAQRDFINAVLRRESGAAISSGEFTNAKQQYFDQPGDKPEVKAQKAKSRQRVIQGMLAAVPPNMRALPEVPQTVAPAVTGAAPLAGGFKYLGRE